MTAVQIEELEDFPDTIEESVTLMSEWIAEASAIKDQIAEYDAGTILFNRDAHWRWRARRALSEVSRDIAEIKVHIAKLRAIRATQNRIEQEERERQIKARKAENITMEKAKQEEARARKEAAAQDNLRRSIREKDAERSYLLEQLRAILTPDQMQAIYAELGAIQRKHRAQDGGNAVPGGNH